MIDKILTFKALNCTDLRIFPGYNEVDVKDKKDLDVYFESRAAQGRLNGYEKTDFIYNKRDKHSNRIDDLIRTSKIIKVKPAIRFVPAKEELDESEINEAIYARELNERLNKSAISINKKNNKISEKNSSTTDQQKLINDMIKKIEILEQKLSSKENK